MTSAEIMVVLGASDRPMTVAGIIKAMGWEMTEINIRDVRRALNHLHDMGRVERKGRILGRRQAYATLWEAVE